MVRVLFSYRIRSGDWDAVYFMAVYCDVARFVSERR